MPLALGVLVDVFPREAAEEDAVEAGMESVQVGTTHVTDARLGLGRETSNNGYVVRESSTAVGGGETIRTQDGQWPGGPSPIPGQLKSIFYFPITQFFFRLQKAYKDPKRGRPKHCRLPCHTLQRLMRFQTEPLKYRHLIKISCNLKRRMAGNHWRCLHTQALLK